MYNVKKYIWSELTSEEIKDLVDRGLTNVFIPFGSTEQHGPHLITGYDYLFAQRLAEDLAHEFGGFVLPPIAYGMAEHHLGFAGTISIGAETLKHLLTDVCKSLENSGIKKIVICNGHGGNYSLIKDFAESWNGVSSIIHDCESKILFSTIKNWKDLFTQEECGLHAGLFETSMAMYTHPNISIRNEKLKKGVMLSEADLETSAVQQILKRGVKSFSETGVIGNPEKSSAELGYQFYVKLLNAYLDFYGKCLL